MSKTKQLPATQSKPPLVIPTQAQLNAAGISRVTVEQVAQAVTQATQIEEAIAKHMKRVDELTAALNLIKVSLIPSVFESAGVKAITLPDGTIVEVKDFIAANIKKDDEAKAFQWLRANKAGAIIKNEFRIVLGKGQDAISKEIAKFVDGLNKKLKKKGEEQIPYSRKPSVNWQTLQAFVKEKLQAGKALPPEINITKVPTAYINHPKEKE